jgi:hypothetical protein
MLIDGTYQLQVGNGGPITGVVWRPRTKMTLTRLKDASGNYRMRPRWTAGSPRAGSTSTGTVPMKGDQVTGTGWALIRSGMNVSAIVDG